MTELVAERIFPPAFVSSPAVAAKALRASAAFWFVTAVAGQLIFALYIAAFYGRSAMRGDYQAWNEILAHGFVAGDAKGNIALAAHLLLAFAITVGGPLQLVPKIRSRAVTVHRWVGRAYVVVALTLSLGGLYLIWSRSALPGWSLPNAIAISINAVLIIVCGVMAWRHAIACRIGLHRRWALRLFIVVSGVWFLRVGVMLWILLFGPAGLGEDLHGPVGIALNFAQYLVPLAVLELYLRAQASPGAAGRLAVAGLIGALAVGTAAGTAMATMFMWLPHIQP